MLVQPCALCGYHAPETACPHCGHAPAEPSLARSRTGPLTGIVSGLLAVPYGLYYLVRTRGIKRWLAPPLFITFVLMLLALYWSFGWLDHFLDEATPKDVELGEWAAVAGLSDRWEWLKQAWGGLSGALEWTLEAGLAFLTSSPLRWLSWFLLGSLVVWYCFSIVYEAFAGPFLDEVQARLEGGWFRHDPRSRLERPNDIPTERCLRLTVAASSLLGGFLVLAWFLPFVPFVWALLLSPLAFLPFALVDRRYGQWLAWVAKVEGRAAWASLQASIITGILIFFALPLYFIPGVGYLLFAIVTGFATAVGLLDIPFERRGWRLRQRLGFLGRNLLPMLAFGVVSGLLLAVPILGPVLMVPSASIGGLWLLCRLEKSSMRHDG